jgi:hypothetical protein
MREDIDERVIWLRWVSFLQQWNVNDLAQVVLEASQPLSVVGAQLLYLGQPFLNIVFPDTHTRALANMLEEPEKTQAFIRLMREAEQK